MGKIRRGRKRVNFLHPAVKRAMEKSGGTLAKLSVEVGVSPQALSQWQHTVPVAHVRKIAKLSGMPRRKIRPDIFG